MAASAKRKQEEKHLKMLREMTSLPPNRKCFDCDQRGPTYANMTVGSFVCTSCSGILRGLNPPHRVKSISMTTFTQQEIEFLQKHGNEVCKRIWLGHHDERTASVPDFREPQKVKEFLQDKYEKKRWYVPPEQAKVAATVHASISGSSNNSSTSSTPEVRPLKSLLGESAPSLHLNKNTPPNQSPVVSRGQTHQQQFHDKRFDLLSDLGGDIFAAPSNMNAGASSGFANFAHFNSHTTAQSANANADFANFDAFGSASGSTGGFPSAPHAPVHHSSTGGLANTNFADFDNFPKSCSADFGSLQSNSTGGGRDAVQSTSLAADRYAALADLDNGFSSAKTEQGKPMQGGGDRYAALAELDTVFGPSVPATSTSCTGLFNHCLSCCVAASFGTGSMSMPAGFGNPAAFNLPTSFSGTFQQPFPGQAPFPQPPAYPQQPNGGGFPAFGQAKPVVTPFGQAMAGSMVSSNPFLGAGPSAQYPAGGSSTNPFL
uniref:ArfGAP with FG repeats 1a n=1 Tax=Gasterosteus aculeatus aculeatus TaxID=481459 RepID=A0AAQ4S4W9_GASAC